MKEIILQFIRFRTLWAYRFNDWRNVPIKECGENLVPLPIHQKYPFYAKEMGLTQDERVFLREEVYDRYLVARDFVARRGYDLVVYDGWRSLDVQKNLFWIYLKEFTVERFHLQEKFSKTKTPREIQECFNSLPEDTQEVLREANRTFVSWPSDHLEKPSPHFTGGSVDVWLHRDGHPVNMGVPFDFMEIEAGAFWHLKFFKPKTNIKITREVAERRTLLVYAMWSAGFSCYPPEFWHYNYGNQMDAMVKGCFAKYGPIAP